MTIDTSLCRTPFEHTGDSANIAYYGERAPQSPTRLWCEVLRSDLVRVNGELVRKRVPDFYVTVYRGTTANRIAEFTYTPRSPSNGALSARTVARLVREHLAEGIAI